MVGGSAALAHMDDARASAYEFSLALLIRYSVLLRNLKGTKPYVCCSRSPPFIIGNVGLAGQPTRAV